MIKKSYVIGVVASALMVSACGQRDDDAEVAERDDAVLADDTAATEETGDSGLSAAPAASSWMTNGSGEGNSLSVADGRGKNRINLFCPSGSDDVVVTLAEFTPDAALGGAITLGSGPDAIALPVNADDNEGRPGVTGRTAYSAEFTTLLASPFVARYGEQSFGPIAAPDAKSIEEFATGCNS